METTEILFDIGTASLAGSIAWWVFRQLRMLFPFPETPPQSRLVRYAYSWLYVDDQAYVAVGAIAFLVATAIAYMTALVTGVAIDWRTAVLGAWSVATWVHHRGKRDTHERA